MARLLFLVHRIPFPPNKGDKIRSFNILKSLSEQHDVVLGSFIDDPSDLQHRASLDAYCKERYEEVVDPRQRKIASLHGLLNGQALSVAFYRSTRFRRWVAEQISSGVQGIVLFSSAMARFIPPSAFEQLPVWMDFVDLDSDKWAQYAAAEDSVLMKWLYRREALTLLKFETAIAKKAAISSFVTDLEVDLFKDRVSIDPSQVIAMHNGVDLDFFTPQTTDAQASNHIVFTGAMDYQANVDAVTWFVEKVFPIVRAKLPDACFTIVGSKPTTAVRALEQIDGVTVTGFVEDIRPYIAKAGVCVAPMRIARGVQNKVLEAMAMGQAVVTTQAGFEGIKAKPGRDVLVCDTAPDFAATILDVLDNKQRRTQLGENARRAMLAEYSWDAALEPLRQFCDSL